ncbi:MAG: tetratricopeptide repeat protein [Nitrospirae bacterium]|nr:tetratricopeptide repeat protein [Nitrospirota bacterium]MBF0534789.1 tetratricopeptide repeat protein [Nitrospirota bacterium]MBF0616463.1 tetratricopeptide repeat protein [Nitrospirota bacterium]
MESPSLTNIQSFISAHTGLHVDEKDLNATIHSRLRHVSLQSSDDYCAFLATDSPESRHEWRVLYQKITTGESFFFRDKGQFSLLRNTILKELIEYNKEKRTLRLWSAGCSTGEEPYSLAIVINELIPDIHMWDITVIGTDINESALDKAAKGIFSDWSFRMVPKDVIATYFIRRKGHYEIEPRIRRMVTFKQGNLIKDNYPDIISGIYDMDLIICRNVFIYFQPENITIALNKLTKSLRDGGYLLTGHAELQAVPHHDLMPIAYPDSTIFRRSDKVHKRHTEPLVSFLPPQIIPVQHIPVKKSEKHHSHKTPSTYATPQKSAIKRAAAVRPSPSVLVDEAKALLKDGKYPQVIEKMRFFLIDNPKQSDAYALLAEAYANTGDLTNAAAVCKEAIAINPLDIRPYYLLAHIAAEYGNLEEGKDMLKRVIYLNSGCIAAYLELSAIYEHTGDTAKALKLKDNALSILDSLPPDTEIEFYSGLTVKELLVQLNNSYVAPKAKSGIKE